MSLCIQTNVLAFREVPGRRRQFTRGQFDVLSCTYIGPTRLKDQFLPSIDSQHVDYPFMRATDVTDTEKPGGLTEVTATYRGKMSVNGDHSIINISMRQIETSGAYQVAGRQVVNPGTPTDFTFLNGTWIPRSVVGKTIKIGTWTFNVRYLSKQAIVKYQSLSRVTVPQMQSQASPIAGYTILNIERSPLSGENQIDGIPVGLTVTATHSFGLTCTDLSVDQVASNLFDCSECWEWKYTSTVTSSL